MRKFGLALVAGAVAALVTGSAWAGNGNGAPSGAHYNLNILGKDWDGKTLPDMTGGNGHRIFVALGGPNAKVETRIWLLPAAAFRVCDANGFDTAYDCDGVALNGGGKLGAVFELPCNTLLPQGGNVGDTLIPVDINVNCNETYTVDANGNVIVVPKDQADLVPTLAYEVWGRALGKPGPGVEATIQTCATVEEIDGTITEDLCSLESALFQRPKGGVMKFQNVTKELTSLVVEICSSLDADGNCDATAIFRIALFAGETEDWFWKYLNGGVKLTQLRFYPMGDVFIP